MMAKTSKWLGVAMLGLAGGSAFAASDWSAGFSSCSNYGTSTSTVTCTNTTGQVDAIQVTAIGTSSYSSGSAFALRDVNHWSGSGLGVDSLTATETSPEHAIDNNAYVEAVLIKFDTSVILDAVTLGWRYQDWDFSVFRYTGSGNPISNPATGAEVSNIKLNATLGGGWELVTTHATSGGCSSACTNALTISNLNANDVSSSWWVISAYSSTYGGSLGSTKDYFKLLSVAGTTPGGGGGGSVPAPGSLALAGLALFGAVAVRRKSKVAAA